MFYEILAAMPEVYALGAREPRFRRKKNGPCREE